MQLGFPACVKWLRNDHRNTRRSAEKVNYCTEIPTLPDFRNPLGNFVAIQINVSRTSSKLKSLLSNSHFPFEKLRIMMKRINNIIG